MNRNRLYLLLGTAIIAGYGYLAWAYAGRAAHNDVTPCLFKNATGIACPSCGSTRSVISIINADFADAALINPLGYFIALLMVMLPLWIVYDITYGKDTLHMQYIKFEKVLKIKWIAILLITLILANWVWNITKGL